MPRTRNGTPSYRLHRPTGQAVVTLNGHDHYLGRHGSPESRSAYDRLIAEWLANGRRPLAQALGGESGVTVNEILLAYLRHADAYYVKDGRPTSESGIIRLALRPLRDLYGRTIASEFGPLKLKAVRQRMLDESLTRTGINQRIDRIKRAFKWAVSEELIPAAVYEGLRSVSGLRRGRCEARESPPVRPVPEAFVEALRPHVARQVWAMIELQRLTGMRPGEVVMMRTIDLDTSGETWTYTPSSHKTEHHGLARVVHLGPRAQGVIRPWLRSELERPLFSPSEAMTERRSAMRAARKSPVQPSQRNRSKVRPRTHPGECYTVTSYRRAIKYGCLKANVPDWHPNQLRHNAATLIRREAGLETARAVLGHTTPIVTEIYAERDAGLAIAAMKKLG